MKDVIIIIGILVICWLMTFALIMGEDGTALLASVGGVTAIVSYRFGFFRGKRSV